MALEVEDGSAKANADSYASQASAAAYHLSLGNTAWAALTSDQKDAALRKATIYLTQFYRMRWAGWRVTNTQALDWPRAMVPRTDSPNSYGGSPDFYPQDEVPDGVTKATMELALRSLSGELGADLAASLRREKIGPIEREWFEGQRKGEVEYPAVEGLLAPYLLGLGSEGFVRVRRA